ncbi:unnamed protein product [Peniophora sp. CBMAI 1063]|nr:unnamed protein product [Peniophora sp. CBMAI 1063]
MLTSVVFALAGAAAARAGTTPSTPPAVGDRTPPDYSAAWAEAYEKAAAFIADLSIEEKVNFTTGLDVSLCTGTTPAIRSFPGLCFQDGPLAVRDIDFTTVFPAGVNTAATWSRSLFRSRGIALGEEFRGKGVNVAFGPAMNMARVVNAGRNFEGFGADPYLAGEAAFETIVGIQSTGVQSCAKHWVDNEQEHGRMFSSSNVDDRTQHEIYAMPFVKSVMAGVAEVMCSENGVNQTAACGNSYLLNTLLKGEIGFNGSVISDWYATSGTSDAANGLDITMPGSNIGGGSPFGGNLTAAVKAGTISEDRLDDMALRILAPWYLLGQDAEDYPKPNYNVNDLNDPLTNQHVDVQGEHWKVVREVGAASIVLLKNEGTLPLSKPRTMVLVGSDAAPARTAGPNEFALNAGVDGVLTVGWGSGTGTFTYVVSPYEALAARARKDHTTMSWYFNDWNTTAAGIAAANQEVAFVFIQSDSGEEIGSFEGNLGDRNNITAWNNGDKLVKAVANANNNTVVVVHSVGPITMPWSEHPNITAVVWAGVSGTEAGNSLADVLYGDVNPSGRLPYTIAKKLSDYPTRLNEDNATTEQPLIQINYTEGLYVDYRHFDKKDIEPLFEFGFGLSYTTFNYSDLSIEAINGTESDLEEAWASSSAGPSGNGTTTALWLHQPAYNVTFTLTNSGSVDGTEIVQLYLNHPKSAKEPSSILRGFDDIYLAAGASTTVSLSLSRYDLSIWDVVSQSWVRPKGTIGVTIGASSRDARLRGSIAQE